MAERVDLYQLINEAVDTRLRGVFTAMPGRVVSYDPGRDSVRVQPLAQRYVPGEDPEADAPTFETLPEISSAPLLRNSGGGFYFATPVASGDFVLLVFCYTGLDGFVVNGDVYAPGDQRVHSIRGAVAIPGLFGPQKLADTSQAAMTFGKDGELKVTVTGSQMEVDGSSDSAALASKVNALWDAFTSATPGSSDGGAALQTAVIAAWTGVGEDVSSEVLKVGS